MKNERTQAFWELMSKLNELNLLPYIMIIGSWAEYLYTNIYTNNYTGYIETRDIDMLYLNINKPSNKVDLITTLKEIDYLYKEDMLTGVAKFRKGDILELEFLTRALGSGSKAITKIPSLNIKSESLRDINILEKYPRKIHIKDFTIIVPEPSIYVIQKILTNPTRTPAWKKPKDIAACEKLLKYIYENEYDKKLFLQIYNELSKKQNTIFHKVIEENNLVLAEMLIQDDFLLDPDELTID